MTTPNVATIGVDIALGHAVETVRDLNQITTAGEKTEREFKSLAGATANLTASQRALAAQGVSLEQVLAAVNQETVDGTKAKKDDKAATEALNAAKRAQVQLGEQMAASISREKALYLQHADALSVDAQIMASKLAAAKRDQIALGEQMAASINRERAMLAAHGEALQINAARTAAIGNAARGAGGSINALRGPLTAATAQLLNLNPAAATTASVLGNFSLGAGPMIGILAGVAALGFAWNKLTADAKKTKEEHEKLLDVLRGLRDKDKFGTENAVEAARADLVRLTAERTRLQAEQDRVMAQRATLGVGSVIAGGAPNTTAIAELNKQIRDRRDLIEQGESELSKLAREAEEDRLREAKQKADARKALLEREIAERKRLMEEYARDAKEREQKAFDDAQRQSLFASAAAGFARLGVQQTGSFRGTFVNPASAAKLGPEMADTAARYAISIREAAEASADLLQNFGATGRHLAEILRLSNSLVPVIERIAQMGNLTRGGSVALGAGAAGFAAGAGGGGLLSGAASGALVGAQLGGPWGAAAGGLIGAGAALLGAANALKDAAAVREARNREGEFVTGGVSSVRDERHALNVTAQGLFDTIRQQFKDGIISAQEFNRRYSAVQDAYQRKWEEVGNKFWASIGEQFNATMGEQGAYQNSLNAIQRAYIENRKNVEAMGGAQDDLNRIEALRVLQIAALNNELEKAASSGLLSRFQSLTGARAPTQTGNQSFLGGSEYLRPLFDNFTKYLDGIEAMKAAAESTAYFAGIQTQLHQQELQTAQESLRVQEATVGGLHQTLDALRRSSASLALGGNSPLTVRQKYNLAETQLEDQFRIAMGGGAAGQKAAQGIGSYIDTFVGLSRERFASGGPSGADYNRAQSIYDALEGIYGTQLTTEEKLYEETKKQTAILEASKGIQENTFVAQLVGRANDKPGETDQVNTILKTLGFVLARNVSENGNPGSYYAQGYTKQQGRAPDQDAYDAYQSAHGNNAELTYSEWIRAGRPAYAMGTNWHRGGPARLFENGPELVNLPRGASVSNSEQFGAPIVRAIEKLQERVDRLAAITEKNAREERNAIYAAGKTS